MPPKRPFVIVLAAIAILALAAVVLPWIGARTPFARDAVARWIAGKTGLPATVASLGIGYFPRPALEIGGLEVGQPPGFGDEPLLEFGKARVSIAWSSLFSAPAVESLAIEDAVARLRISRDGSDNWSALIDRLAEAGGTDKSAWSLGRLAFERGALEFADATSGAQWRLTAITIGAEDVAPEAEFPARLSLAAVSGARTYHFAIEGRGRVDPDLGRYEANGLDFRGWAGGEPLPLAGLELTGRMELASFNDATGLAEFERGSFNLAGIPGEFAGRLDLGEAGTQTAFSLKTDDFAPRAPAIAFGHPLPVTADAEAFSSVQLTLESRLEGGVLHLDPVTGRIDDTLFHGKAIPEQRLIRANFDRVDVDRYLAPGQKKKREKKETLEAAIARLGQFDIDAEIRIDEASVAGAKLRDAIIRIERNLVEVQ